MSVAAKEETGRAADEAGVTGLLCPAGHATHVSLAFDLNSSAPHTHAAASADESGQPVTPAQV